MSRIETKLPISVRHVKAFMCFAKISMSFSVARPKIDFIGA